MNIDLLIKMTNEIGQIFAGATPPEQAPNDIANHLRRYWEPRMRAQMLEYYEQRQGAGLASWPGAALRCCRHARVPKLRPARPSPGLSAPARRPHGR